MKIAAIICEYNPLHNGHLRHIQETRRHGATHIIAILSDNFVQRGDVALLGKFDRAALAVRAGADLVLELPAVFSCSPAERYATYAVSLIGKLHIVNLLSFGCSAQNAGVLAELAASMQELTASHAPRLQQLVKEGVSYPAALAALCRQHGSEEQAQLLQDPNNLLAIEYLRAVQGCGLPLDVLAVPREQVAHDSLVPGESMASASYLRQELYHPVPDVPGVQRIRKFVPPATSHLLEEAVRSGRTASMAQLESVLLYRLRTMTEAELAALPDMTPALAGRFRKARYAVTFPELLEQVKTKCFTMARIRRILCCALLGITAADRELSQPYARILAFSRNGCTLLKKLKQTSEIPVGTSLKKLAMTSPEAAYFAEMAERTAHVYGLARQKPTSAQEEFQRKISLQEQDGTHAGIPGFREISGIS